MGFAEVLASFVSSPKRLYSSIRDTVLPTPSGSKRSREESTNAELDEFQPETSRLKLTEAAQEKAAGTAQGRHRDTLASSQPVARPFHSTTRPLNTERGPAQAIASRLQPPRWPYSAAPSPRVVAAYEAGFYGTPRLLDSPAALANAPARPKLYASIAPRRHGPQSSFRRNLEQTTPAESPLPVSSSFSLKALQPCSSHALECRRYR